MNEDIFIQQLKIKETANTIEKLIYKIDNNQTDVKDLLKEEICRLKSLHLEYEKLLEGKKIVHTDNLPHKTRHYLKDGSTYVVDNKRSYRYLFDAKSRSITYHFSNGQTETTFVNGIKEIRYPDGTISVKLGEKDYEYYK